MSSAPGGNQGSSAPQQGNSSGNLGQQQVPSSNGTKGSPQQLGDEVEKIGKCGIFRKHGHDHFYWNATLEPGTYNITTEALPQPARARVEAALEQGFELLMNPVIVSPQPPFGPFQQ